MLRYLFLLIIVFQVFANQVSAAEKSLIASKSEDNNRYYLIFAARGSTSEGTSLTGHAFVMWGLEDQEKKQSSYYGFGWYPEDGEKGVIKEVKGEIVDEARKHSWPATTDRLIVEVSKSDYDKADRTRQNWNSEKGFKLGKRDCITFLQTVAGSVGVVVPERKTFATPREYIQLLVASGSIASSEAKSNLVIKILRSNGFAQSKKGDISVTGTTILGWNLLDASSAGSSYFSSIPAGEYVAKITKLHNDKGLHWKIELVGVPDKATAQLHIGNPSAFTEKQGVILLGKGLTATGKGPWRPSNADEAINEFKSAVDSQLNVTNNTPVVIKVSIKDSKWP